MTEAAIRHKLQDYLEIADIKKIKALYTIFENEIEETLSNHGLTEDQMNIVEERRANYLVGKSKTHRWDDVKDTIGKRI
jgi:hypothetical protein